MREWSLLLIFILLATLALAYILYPLRQSRRLLSFLTPLMLIALIAAYWQWGAWDKWQAHLQKEEQALRVEALLKTVNGPSQLIEKMKAHIKQNPENPRGWYLLGRLYGSQNQWEKARDAFLKARELNPDDEGILVNYAQSLWQINHQRGNEAIRDLFKNILTKNPNQPDSLALLAVDAYHTANYPSAIDYWQQLLKIAPPQSEEASMIRKAIAKAQHHLH
ncbi:MAG: tetratricopeptide repeat protein [Tatlockia sp.]|jgi:cytochrome c-type biogenesis protein CcmH/NrfG